MQMMRMNKTVKARKQIVVWSGGTCGNKARQIPQQEEVERYVLIPDQSIIILYIFGGKAFSKRNLYPRTYRKNW